MAQKLTIAFTRREAELYRSHGLLEEARRLYRQVLDEAGALGPALAASLKEKICALEDELATLDIDLAEVVSDRELCILREGWGDAQSAGDIGICAAALGSIGLHEAAIEEYRKLVRLGEPPAGYLQGFVDCLLAVYSPAAIQTAILAVLTRDQPEGAHPTALRIAFAMELARRGLDRPALALYESARSIQPLPPKLEPAVAALERRLQAGETPPPTSDAGGSAAHQRKLRLANRLARLRRLIRRLRA